MNLGRKGSKWSIDAIIDLIFGISYRYIEKPFRAAIVIQYILAGWITTLLLYDLYRKRSKLCIDWNEQLAVVTGSSGGLGRAIVEELQRRGCRIAAIDIIDIGSSSKDKSLLYIKANLANSKEVYELREKIGKHFDQLPTILISNAGIMVGKRVLDFDEGQFEKTIYVNLIATYYLMRSFLPGMLASGQGHIVAISSIMGYISISQLTDYVASKHALIGFLESLQYEIDKKYNKPAIKTTLVILGKLSTPLFARTKILSLVEFFTPTQDPTKVAKAIIDRIERRERGALYMPYLTRLAPLLKAMPNWFRDMVQWASGADEALQKEESHGDKVS